MHSRSIPRLRELRALLDRPLRRCRFAGRFSNVPIIQIHVYILGSHVVMRAARAGGHGSDDGAVAAARRHDAAALSICSARSRFSVGR